MTIVASYRYRAARRDGTLERGVVEGATRESVNAVLADRGLFPMEIVQQETAEQRKPGLKPADAALGLRVLADLLDSGLPLSKSLAALGELAPASWTPLLESARVSIREGSSFGRALVTAPVQLSPIVVGIIQAGEAGSGLAAAVRRSAELMEDTAVTHAALRNALAYPLLLAVGGAGAVALLVGVVLPRFAAILADLGQTLPSSTRIVLAAAASIRTAAIPVAVAAAIVALLWYRSVSTPSGRRSWHDALLSLPWIGRLRLSSATARSMASLAALLDAGVPIAVGLQQAGVASGDAAVARRMSAARESVLHGARVSGALAASAAATTTAVRLTRAGEESGRLAPMLAHAAKLERERASQMVKSLVRFIEPAMIVAFGGLIAFIASALLQAIYSVRPGQ